MALFSIFFLHGNNIKLKIERMEHLQILILKQKCYRNVADLLWDDLPGHRITLRGRIVNILLYESCLRIYCSTSHWFVRRARQRAGRSRKIFFHFFSFFSVFSFKICRKNLKNQFFQIWGNRPDAAPCLTISRKQKYKKNRRILAIFKIFEKSRFFGPVLQTLTQIWTLIKSIDVLFLLHGTIFDIFPSRK